jgi:uncharacterized RDD family membrane protein YckC
LSTQPVPQTSWKQEVNKRIEAHKNRRGISVVEQDVRTDEQGGVSDRAAQAAARVAARFSKAPSYSEMLAAEARTALRNAEAATRAALEAQTVAQAALANLAHPEEQEQISEVEEHFVYESEPEPAQRNWDPEPVSAPVSHEQTRSWEIRWEPDLPVRPSSPPTTTARPQPEARVAVDDWGAPRPVDFEHEHAVVEPAQPIHANLIHFPRELVATRRMRPRIATSATGEVSEQLSIFEVDPTTISIDPMASVAEAAMPAPSWCSPEWSSMELDAQPHREREARHEPVAAPRASIYLAPLESRLLAATIDFALVIGMVCAAGLGMAGHLHHALAMKSVELGAVGAFLLTGFLYQAFFLLTVKSTPGMMYAGISLCTFDEEHPTHVQLRDRLGALLVSVLPVGLGMAWAIFDEDHLSWHDRFSRTYQRKC